MTLIVLTEAFNSKTNTAVPVWQFVSGNWACLELSCLYSGYFPSYGFLYPVAHTNILDAYLAYIC